MTELNPHYFLQPQTYVTRTPFDLRTLSGSLHIEGSITVVAVSTAADPDDLRNKVIDMVLVFGDSNDNKQVAVGLGTFITTLVSAGITTR